jgi:hypothetical protein
MRRFLIARSGRRLVGAGAITAVVAALAVSMVVTAPALGSATVFQQMEQGPLAFAITNPCNDETVYLSGDSFLVYVVTMDGAGGAHVEFHFFYHLTGEGGLGNAYQLLNVSDEVANVPVGTAFTFAFQTLTVSSGSAGNFDITVLVHTTVNPDGTITSSQAFVNVACRGSGAESLNPHLTLKVGSVPATMAAEAFASASSRLTYPSSSS